MTWAPTVPLRELVEFSGGGTPQRTNPEFFGGSIPWVTPKDMRSHLIDDSAVRLTEEGLAAGSARMVSPASVLIVVRSGVLKHRVPIAVSTAPVALNQDVKALTPSGRVDAGFLAWFLKARESTILGWVRGTTADSIPVAKLAALPVPLPPLGDQRRVARVLDLADALRAKRNETVRHLDDFARSIFVDMVGFGEEAAKRWPTVLLGQLVQIGPQNGLYKPASAYGSGTPIVRIDSFQTGGQLDVDALRRVRVSDAERLTWELSEGDILVNRVNSLSHLGKSCVVPFLTESTLFESNMMRLAVDQDRADASFVVAALGTPELRGQILRSARAAINQASINQTDVKSLRLPAPPLEVQRSYRKKVERVLSQKMSAQRHLRDLDALLSSLQQRAFRGDLFDSPLPPEFADAG